MECISERITKSIKVDIKRMRLTQQVSFCFFMRGEKFRRITTEN